MERVPKQSNVSESGAPGMTEITANMDLGELTNDMIKVSKYAPLLIQDKSSKPFPVKPIVGSG